MICIECQAQELKGNSIPKQIVASAVQFLELYSLLAALEDLRLESVNPDYKPFPSAGL